MAARPSVALKRIRRLATQRRVRFTLKALQELADLDLHLDPQDACDVLAGLKPGDLVDRLQSDVTGEWMYVFKPRVAATVLYVKVILRDDCLVVSFHEDDGPEHDQDT